MPKYYGTALYGRGNYSAATGIVLTATQGALVQAGSAASPTWQSRLAATTGSQSVAGQDAALSWQAVVSAAGFYGLTGDVAFAKSNIWNGMAAAAGGWAPRNPEDNSWTPAMPAPQNWNDQ